MCPASFVYPKNIWKIRYTPKKYFLKLDFMRRLARAFDRPNSEMKSHTLGAHSQTAEAKKDFLDKIQCAIGNQILTSESKVLIAGINPRGGTLIFSAYVGLDPASTVHPKKISEI